MSRDNYFAQMKPYADRASQALSIPSVVILAQWGLETGFGSSTAARKLNNHAGIKSNSAGADYNGGTYAGYNSLASFTTDYIRVMNLSYYKKVREVGKTGDVAKTVKALDDSPWAEDTAYYGKIMNIINGSKNYSTPSPSVGGTGAINIPGASTDLLGDIKNVLNGATDSQVKQFAMVGIGAVILAKILD